MRFWPSLFTAILLLSATIAFADEPEVGWRVDFGSPTGFGGVHYVQRGDTQDTTGMIMKIGNGSLTFGAERDQAGAPWDRAVLAWGKCMPYGFWTFPPSEFQPVDIQKYPVIEIRARKVPGADPGMCFSPIFDTPSGVSFTQMNPTLTDEWQTFTFRFSPLSSVPGPRIPTHVIGLIFLVQPWTTKPSAFEINWIRIRAFTPEEKVDDDVIASHLASYKVPEWKQPFFVYGPYGPSIRGTARQGGFEGAYGGMVKAHANYLMCPHDLSYYRFQGVSGKTQEQNVAEFVAVNKEATTAAANVGLNMGLDIRGFSSDLKAKGRDYIIPGIRQVTDAFKNQPSVLGYTAGDEPQTNNLWEIVGVKQIFEEQDSAKLVAWPLADALWAPDFEPYSTIQCGDRYPILSKNRNCSDVANQMDEFNKATTKPLWFIIQSIGDRTNWTVDRQDYQMPTEAEFLRMAFMAISRGAKGLLYFDWYHTPFADMVDRYGNPGPLYSVSSKLGERLAAVGSILLRCEVPKNGFELPAVQVDGKPAFEVRVLKMSQPEGKLYVVCGADISSERAMDIPMGQLTQGQAFFNLESLEVIKQGRLKSDKVAAGDARLFALVNQKDIPALKKEIFANRKRETDRVAQPGKVIEKRWFGRLPEMKSIDTILSQCAITLGRLEDGLLIGDDKAKPGKDAAWSRCKDLGRQYDDLRIRHITADRTGLADAATQLKTDLDALDREAGE